MKKLNLIKLVDELLFYSNLNLDKEYNNIRNILKENYEDKFVFTTMKYLKGEFTESQEKTFLELHKGI
tara:strand:- start:581 stop:784 length:204 start_codon:yes stop_codon:yes gene_type:complete